MKTFFQITRNQTLLWVGILALVFWAQQSSALAAASLTPTIKRVGAFELKDQYDTVCSMSFPKTNLTILTIADQKGSDQVQGWVKPLKERYNQRIDISGIADMGAVPALLRGLVQSKFKKTCTYPVMLDWSGLVAKSFGYEKNQVSLLVINRDGTVLKQWSGEMDDRSLESAFETIDRFMELPQQ
jgi:hypothetical protein